MHKKFFNFAYVMNFMIQLLFTTATPIGLSILLGWWLHYKVGAPKWVFIVLIVFGALIGVYSLFRYIIAFTKYIPYLNESKNGNKNKSDERGNANK